MAEVSYIFGDALTGQIIQEINCFGVYITKQFGGGQMQCSFTYDQTGKDNDALRAATIPGRSFAVCERDGKPIWGGIVWSRTYQSQAKVASLYCMPFEEYSSRRLIRQDYKRDDVEQQSIFLELYGLMQADPNSIDVTLPSVPALTLLEKSIDIKATEYKTYRSAFDILTSGEDGFDWRIDTSRSDNVYTHKLKIGYPILGTGDPSAVVFDYPGNILNYWNAESMSDAGTYFFGEGAGEGSDMLVETYAHTDLLSAGFPRYDIEIPAKDVTSRALLRSIVAQQAKLRRPPMPVITAEVKADLDPIFGSYFVGDACTLSLDSAQFGGPGQTNGLFEKATRVLGFEYYPPSDDTVEFARLAFEGDDL